MPGVLKNINDKESLIGEITPNIYNELKSNLPFKLAFLKEPLSNILNKNRNIAIKLQNNET